MISILCILLIGLMVARIPLFIVFLLSTMVAIAFFTPIPANVVIQRTFSGLDKFPLMAVPMFILAANVMTRGGMSERVIGFAKAVVGPLPGGLALTTVFACMLFGAVSGSSPATVIAIGGILLPAMLKQGYPQNFSVGLVTSSASVSAIIPPSIGMIIYGTVASVSIGKLFMAAVIPSIIYGLMFMLYALIYSAFRLRDSRETTSLRAIAQGLRESIWALGVPVIIIGGIYGGIMTPTEAAAAAAVYTIFVAMFIYREINFRQLVAVAVESAAITAQIMILIGAASALSWLLTVQRIPMEMAQWLTSMVSSEVGILLMINVILIVAGMFLDPTSVTVIFAPLFLPIAASIGVDPIHLGIIILVNGALGMFTPPFGFNLFVAASLSRFSIARLSAAVFPFALMTLLVVVLVTFVPSVSLWLPDLLQMR